MTFAVNADARAAQLVRLARVSRREARAVAACGTIGVAYTAMTNTKIANAQLRRAQDGQIAREIDEYLDDAEAARFVIETERKVAESSAHWGFAYADESGHYSPKLYDDAQRAAQIRWDVRQIKQRFGSTQEVPTQDCGALPRCRGARQKN